MHLQRLQHPGQQAVQSMPDPTPSPMGMPPVPPPPLYNQLSDAGPGAAQQQAPPRPSHQHPAQCVYLPCRHGRPSLLLFCMHGANR